MPHQSKRLLVSQTLLVVLLLLAFGGSAQAQIVGPTPTPRPVASPCPTPDVSSVVIVGESPVARIEAIALSKNGNQTIRATIKEARIIRRYGSEEPATVNAELYEGDSVETGDESFVSVLFATQQKDADQVILYPNTRITIGTAWNWWGPILNRVRGYFRSGTTQGTGGSRGTEYFLIVCDKKHQNSLCKDKDLSDRTEKLVVTAIDDSVNVLTYDISIDRPYSDPSGNRFLTVKRRQANLFARMLQVILFRKPRGRYYKVLPPSDMPWLRFSPPEIILKKGQSAKVMPSIDNPDDVEPKRYSGDLKVECSDPDCDRYKLDVIFSATAKATLPIVVTVKSTNSVNKGQQLTMTKGADQPAVAAVDKSEARQIVEEASEIILSLQSPDLVEHVMPNYLSAETRYGVFMQARTAALIDNSTAAYVKLGEVNLDWGRGEKALSAFEKIPQKDSAEFHFNLAEAYRLIGELDEAEKEIETALPLDWRSRYQGRPSNTQGNVYLDRAKEMISHYKSVPTQYKCYRAQLLGRAHDYLDRAREMYLTSERALEQEKETTRRAIPLRNLGEVYLLQSQLFMEDQAPLDKISRVTDEALKAYTEALEEHPRYSYAASGQGYALLRKAQLAMLQGYQGDSNKFSENARESFDKAISIQRNLKSAFIGRSIANQYLGDLEAAKKDIKSVIKLDPNAIPTVEVPDVMKKPEPDAVRLIMDAGLFPEVSGSGHIVVDQTPWAGMDIPVGSVVKLRLGRP